MHVLSTHMHDCQFHEVFVYTPCTQAVDQRRARTLRFLACSSSVRFDAPPLLLGLSSGLLGPGDSPELSCAGGDLGSRPP